MFKNSISCEVHKLNQKQMNHDDTIELPTGMVLQTMPGFGDATIMNDMVFKTYHVSINLMFSSNVLEQKATILQ